MEKILEKIPVFNPQSCIRCDACIAICPTEAIAKFTSEACSKCIKYCITMKVPCQPDYYIIDYDKCNRCGLCIEICETQSITWFIN